MTKQITIKEDGVSKSESVDFINTQVAGGSANWMPEDEANVGAIRITSNGEYVPSEYGFYGFHMVAVQVPGGAGGQSGPSGEYVVPLPATEVTASVIGVDPVDGAVYRVEIQDVDGVPTLVKTKVADTKAEYKPTSIRILLKPAKLSYKVGEKIQYAGLVVELLDSDGHTFVDETFPQGIISWSPVKNLLHPEYDLITPIEIAAGEDVDVSSVDWEPKASKFTNFPIICRKADSFKCVFHISADLVREPYLHSECTYIQTFKTDRNVRFAAFSGHAVTNIGQYDYLHLVAACETVFNVSIEIECVGDEGDFIYTGYFVNEPVTHEQKSAYVYAVILSPQNKYRRYDSRLEYTSIPTNERLRDYGASVSRAIGWGMVHGDISNKGTIPVQWKSPYDNRTYEDTFEIEVTDG